MDNYEGWTIELPKTAAAWEEGRMDDLGAELDDDLAGEMLEFVDEACESGGWPEDDEVTVHTVVISGNVMTVQVTVDFTELIASGCMDLPNSERRVARFVVTLEREDTTALVEYSPSDPNTWDQADRNSAGDGN
jgi:hypothetical protein